MSLPISREEAYELLKKYNSHEKDFVHYFESEAVMRELADRLGEDKEYWGMLGLLHDIDWGITKDNSKEHITKAPTILRAVGFDEDFIETVISHTYGFDCADNLHKKRTKKIEHALAASETITGLIHAYAIMRGNKISGMKVKGLKKKFKDKTFAAAIERDIIRECEKLGISLEEFMETAIDGIKKIKEAIGLE